MIPIPLVSSALAGGLVVVVAAALAVAGYAMYLQRTFEERLSGLEHAVKSVKENVDSQLGEGHPNESPSDEAGDRPTDGSESEPDSRDEESESEADRDEKSGEFGPEFKSKTDGPNVIDLSATGGSTEDQEDQ